MSYSNVKISRKYAKVLFDLSSQDILDQREKNLYRFLGIFQNISKIMLNPVISYDEKFSVLMLAIDELKSEDFEFDNFLKLVFENKRLIALEDIYVEFSNLIKASRNVILLEITVSKPLGDEEKGDIYNKLRQLLNKDISIKWNVDSSIIGGVIIKVGDKLLDTSLRGFLNKATKEIVSIHY